MQDQVELDISRTILDTVDACLVNTVQQLSGQSYSLFIDPFTAIESESLHEPTMEDLKMHRRAPKRSEAEIPCSYKHLFEARA